MKTALAILVFSSIGHGFMSIIRKEYQKVNGPNFTATAFFLAIASLVAGIIGLCISREISIGPNTILATVYATISTVTAGICIFATAYGNLSTLMLFATLGTLVLPSAFGIIFQPEENSLTAFKLVGFIFALICLTLNFLGKKEEKKASNLLFKILCLVIFFTNGMALIIFKFKIKLCPTYPHFSFVAEYMLISALFAALALLFSKKRINTGEFKNTILKKRKNYALILGYAAISFACEILAINCANILPLVIQSPLSFGLTILATALLDYKLYKAKPSKYNILQMVFALLCCICFVIS